MRHDDHEAFADRAAAGAFAIGTTEFVIIGLVPGIARDLGITLPAAGLLVSGYALAVTAGAPTVTALVGHLPRRPLAVGLMLLFALGNLLSGFASGYGAMLAGRIIVPLGLPNRESPRTGISVLWFRPCRPEQEGGGESCGDSEMARTGFRRPAARPQAAVKGYASPAPRTPLRKRRSEGSISTSGDVPSSMPSSLRLSEHRSTISDSWTPSSWNRIPA
ncbi:MAG: MFS transporter [Mesorhizobium sp.]|nr:MAG: MFS transporter [Mesorhizobium sp.]